MSVIDQVRKFISVFKINKTILLKAKKFLIYAFIVVLLSLFLPNIIILWSTRNLISESIDQINNADAGIILGAAVYSRKRVSTVVSDRIEAAVQLYKMGKIKKILISGDHGERYYDEVNTIKFWLLKNNIPPEDIFLDHSGFSTYESIMRARKIFGLQNVVIITQSYHLPRSLYLAIHWRIIAQGYAADQRIYKKAKWFMIREYLARVKDFFYIHSST